MIISVKTTPFGQVTNPFTGEITESKKSKVTFHCTELRVPGLDRNSYSISEMCAYLWRHGYGGVGVLNKTAVVFHGYIEPRAEMPILETVTCWPASQPNTIQKMGKEFVIQL